ncbi:MAG: hypothetical protein RLY31_2790, partial [Bacteroidota bacterium]
MSGSHPEALLEQAGKILSLLESDRHARLFDRSDLALD